MAHKPPLTKKQARNFNKRFGLGVYRKKCIQDYPLLHRYLANIFGGAHDAFLRGISVKLTLGAPRILDESHAPCRLAPDFWMEKLGSYTIESCNAFPHSIQLDFLPPLKADTFYPDDFILLTSSAQCQVLISEKGTISAIDLYFNTKPPSFIRELASHFALGGRFARTALRQEIKSLGEEPDETFLASIKFGRATTIEV